jgi:hypothetical protein
MRWVEERSYVGPDRRRARKFRLFDRRTEDRSIPLPAIQVLLRQLHLKVLDVATAREAIAQFQFRVQIASQATQERGEEESAQILARVERKLEAKGEASDETLTQRETAEIQGLVTDALCALKAG